MPTDRDVERVRNKKVLDDSDVETLRRDVEKRFWKGRMDIIDQL